MSLEEGAVYVTSTWMSYQEYPHCHKLIGRRTALKRSYQSRKTQKTTQQTQAKSMHIHTYIHTRWRYTYFHVKSSNLPRSSILRRPIQPIPPLSSNTTQIYITLLRSRLPESRSSPVTIRDIRRRRCVSANVDVARVHGLPVRCHGRLLGEGEIRFDALDFLGVGGHLFLAVLFSI